MANIQVLDQNTINQIAAGEVIERPASVVKELLENAIDSRATAVTVEIQGGGLASIRVTDNGCGIPGDEIPLAFTRHATSKIRTAADLFGVSSLGFRGEALASIASVSRVELITRTAGSIGGFRCRIEGGSEPELEEVGAPEGTTFLVRDLFYNTPVRKKFLKSPAAEGGHVADLVEKIALSHPEVSVRFINNGQIRLHTSGNHSLKDIIYTVFGREITANLIPVKAGAAPVCVEGFIGKPLIARGNRNYETYFINGRFIRNGLVNRAIEDAYKPYMMQHKYPFTMLHLTIDPSFIDVNVHPAKMELRFKDGDMVYRTVYHIVSMALSGRELIPQVTLDPNPAVLKPVLLAAGRLEPFESGRRSANAEGPHPADLPDAVSGGAAKTPAALRPVLIREHPAAYGAENTGQKPEKEPGQKPGEEAARMPEEEPGQKPGEEPAQRPEKEPGREEEKEAEREQKREPEQEAEKRPAEEAEQKAAGNHPAAKKAAEETEPRQMDLFEDRLLTKEARAGHILIGQIFDTYWLVQYRDNLYIIDQHAAHEKVLYERTMASLAKREYASQMVSPPIILTLNSSESLLLEENLEHFAALGFEIEAFGGREYAVRAVPANLFSIAKKELLLEMLDDLAGGGRGGTPERVRERIASLSCKAAVKGNHVLSAAEANRLIDELLTLENPYACPHGRPTIISMSRRELEKKFKRIV